ncbi:hypothetical protein [Pseudomonas protegens]|uniref:hypothetical protein n=1 Tax=Pseudomonas protegens TaxID=380021 RepID=UPI0011CE834D|nr:hypothetical protein [Pseudomonas protegens]
MDLKRGHTLAGNCLSVIKNDYPLAFEHRPAALFPGRAAQSKEKAAQTNVLPIAGSGKLPINNYSHFQARQPPMEDPLLDSAAGPPATLHSRQP